MTENNQSRLNSNYRLARSTIKIIETFASDRDLPKSRALDLIVSEWEIYEEDKQAEAVTDEHCIRETRDIVEKLDRRLSRIEQNIVTQNAIEAQ